MIVSVDVKGLEVVTAAWLSNDKVLIQELRDGVDIHGENQKAFGFGEGKAGRLVAKRFKFKMIYGGTAHGFATDYDFRGLGFSVRRWDQTISEYYSKYSGIARWHNELIAGVVSTGFYESPSGRKYDFRMLLGNSDGYYIPKIKNYPVQGFGADIVKIIRISLYKRWQPEWGKLVNTVHDDIQFDIKQEMWYNISSTVRKVFEDLPENLSKCYKIKWDLPIHCEFKTLTGEELK